MPYVAYFEQERAEIEWRRRLAIFRSLGNPVYGLTSLKEWWVYSGEDDWHEVEFF